VFEQFLAIARRRLTPNSADMPEQPLANHQAKTEPGLRRTQHAAMNFSAAGVKAIFMPRLPSAGSAKGRVDDAGVIDRADRDALRTSK